MIEINALEKVRNVLAEQISLNLKTRENSNFEKDCYSRLAYLTNDTMMLIKQLKEGEEAWKHNQKLIHGN